MSNVTRFPHYHQAENVVTNHLMVLLRELYNSSPKLLEKLLQALCEDEIEIGPRFKQQVAGSNSVPDGLIAQNEFAIFIETKIYDLVNNEQLERHCQSIIDRASGAKAGRNILIALTAGHSKADIDQRVQQFAADNAIRLLPATFGSLVKELRGLAVTDLALKEMIVEFEEFVFAQGLVPRTEQFLTAMLTRFSWRDNAAHGIYYEPAERNPKWKHAAFLGLYHDKQISHVGRIVTAVVAKSNEAGEIEVERSEKGQPTHTQLESIKSVIAAGQSYHPGFQETAHRYYIVDTFTPLELKKISYGGMMGHRYLDIEEIAGVRLPESSPGSEAAKVLNGRTFQ